MLPGVQAYILGQDRAVKHRWVPDPGPTLSHPGYPSPTAPDTASATAITAVSVSIRDAPLAAVERLNAFYAPQNVILDGLRLRNHTGCTPRNTTSPGGEEVR